MPALRYNPAMNWTLAMPAIFFFLLLGFFFVARWSGHATLLRRTYRQLLALLGLSLLLNGAASRMGAGLLRGIVDPGRVVFGLWLLLLVFLLVFFIRLFTFLIFDVFVTAHHRARYPRVLRDLLVFALYVVGLLLILKFYLHMGISWLSVSSAVLTVVVGLAVQDILGNLFSGIILNFEDVFELGDWIRINGQEGRIEQLGWRAILIRTVDRELLAIPNQAASKADVLIRGPNRLPVALRVCVGAHYRHPPDTVCDAIGQAVRGAADVLAEPPPQVIVKDFADSAVLYEVKFWTIDYGRATPICGDVRRRIWYAFRRLAIDIPFPIRDLIMHPPGADAPAFDDRRELAAALRENDVLTSLDESQLTNLLAGTEVQMFGGGEVIIREGDPGDSLYHILEGRVRILKEGRELALLGRGDFFGEISLVTGEPVSATVETVSHSRLLRVTSARFRESVDMNETMARKLSEVITRRQDEMRSFSEKGGGDAVSLKKNSENLFRRIINYFGLND
jgi:small-conductance mechanosensitive channel/CRP-like cAMP-binding protein